MCGDKKQARGKTFVFQGLATQLTVQIRPIRRTCDMTAACFVKAIDRGATPLIGLFLASLVISNAISITLMGPDPRLY